MPGRAADLIEIPDSFWKPARTLDALRARDMGRLFHLLRQYAGISQTRLAIACDMTQPKISGIMRGTQQVTALGVFERIADGLNMPSPARLAMGLAPVADTPPQLERAIPSRDSHPDLAVATVSDVLSADPADDENGGEVRRRTFVGLTGASLFGALLAEPTRPGPADAIESLTTILAAYSPTLDADLGRLPDLTTLSAAVTRAKQGYQGLPVHRGSRRTIAPARPLANGMRRARRRPTFAGLHSGRRGLPGRREHPAQGR
jgi:transcriptional regulator with XRE-family HTH domain